MTEPFWWRTRFREHGEKTALVWRGREVSYAELLETVDGHRARLEHASGRVVLFASDYHPEGVAALLALIEAGAITALVAPGLLAQRRDLLELSRAQVELSIAPEGEIDLRAYGGTGAHPLFDALREENRPGLVLFSSGSEGKMKGVVHDALRLVAKHAEPRRARVSLPFMLFDHIGGLNTLLQISSSGGTAVLAEDRAPEAIARLVEAHRVEALPASPTFLNLLLLSEREPFDLSSLEVIGYGAEPMPAATLERLQARFPGVRLVQNYGLSEVGILDTRSRASGSLWVKLGGDGVKTRVRDGMLEIRAETAMLGYLEEPSPFTADGWLKTGDRVEVDGEWVKILGRASDLIIVGGEKVYPSEVEALLMALPHVVEVVVEAEPHALTGQLVKATVRLDRDEGRSAFRARMLDALGEAVPAYKIPRKLKLTREPLHGRRFKKLRRVEEP